MLAIQTVFDGNCIVPSNLFPSGKKYNVVVNFVEEVTSINEVTTVQNNAHKTNFWECVEENIFNDYSPHRYL